MMPQPNARKGFGVPPPPAPGGAPPPPPPPPSAPPPPSQSPFSGVLPQIIQAGMGGAGAPATSPAAPPTPTAMSMNPNANAGAGGNAFMPNRRAPRYRDNNNLATAQTAADSMNPDNSSVPAWMTGDYGGWY